MAKLGMYEEVGKTFNVTFKYLTDNSRECGLKGMEEGRAVVDVEKSITTVPSDIQWGR